MKWDDTTVQLLCQFWSEGDSTATIGRKLNITKNAVVGKAHRMDLEARPSPIRRPAGALAPPATKPRPPAVALAPLLSSRPMLPLSIDKSTPQPILGPHAAPWRIALPAVPANIRRLPAPPPRPAAQPKPVPIAAFIGKSSKCCFPIGEPGRRDFKFCDAVSLRGKPYCDKHHKLTHIKIRDRQEDDDG